MPPQRLSWKRTIEKRKKKTEIAKNTKLQFGPNPELMLSKSSRGFKLLQLKLGWEINIHITWTQNEVKGENLKNLPKNQILEFVTKINTRHTFWS